MLSLCCRSSLRRVAAVGGNGSSVAPASSTSGASTLTSSAKTMSKPTPRPLVLCGPSGSGKSTLMKRLTEEFPNAFGFSVSHTTRKPRPGEQNGVHYHYVERPELEAMVERGEFIESAEFSGNLYGTSVGAVGDVTTAGKICILDIEMQGVIQIKEKRPGLKCMFVFVKPPSMEVLEQRLRERATETEESLQKRLDTAKRELVYGEGPGNFDIVITNDNLDTAYKQLREFVLPEIQKIAT